MPLPFSSWEPPDDPITSPRLTVCLDSLRSQDKAHDRMPSSRLDFDFLGLPLVNQSVPRGHPFHAARCRPHCMGTHAPIITRPIPSTIHSTKRESLERRITGHRAIGSTVRIPNESNYCPSNTSPYPPTAKSHLASSHCISRYALTPRHAMPCTGRGRRTGTGTPTHNTVCTRPGYTYSQATTSKYLLACSAACYLLHSVALSTKFWAAVTLHTLYVFGRTPYGVRALNFSLMQSVGLSFVHSFISQLDVFQIRTYFTPGIILDVSLRSLSILRVLSVGPPPPPSHIFAVCGSSWPTTSLDFFKCPASCTPDKRLVNSVELLYVRRVPKGPSYLLIIDAFAAAMPRPQARRRLVSSTVLSWLPGQRLHQVVADRFRNLVRSSIIWILVQKKWVESK